MFGVNTSLFEPLGFRRASFFCPRFPVDFQVELPVSFHTQVHSFGKFLRLSIPDQNYWRNLRRQDISSL